MKVAERNVLWTHLRESHGFPKSRYFYLHKTVRELRALHDQAHKDGKFRKEHDHT